jgi:hypothetical protein
MISVLISVFSTANDAMIISSSHFASHYEEVEGRKEERTRIFNFAENYVATISL